MEKNYLDFHTAEEIEKQPDLWLKVADYLKSRKKSISDFLLPLLKKEGLNIMLTGAGSSAFIGKAIKHAFEHNLGVKTTAISTTSLVTHFTNYVSPDNPLLMISFARSGNSPESNAVVDLANSKCKEVYHIAVTCNSSGNLANKIQTLEKGLTLVLPPETEDKGLAMTGSFTGMMLAGLYLARFKTFEGLKDPTQIISKTAEDLLQDYTIPLEQLASTDFDRIVFLGSGPLLGVARESHLKVQELTDGVVIGKHDSFLGLRHGPKAVIHDKTVIVYLFSSDPHVFRYERDLANEVTEDGMDVYSIGVFGKEEQAKEVQCDLNIIFNSTAAETSDELHLLPYVLPAQIIGYYKSLQLGLNPDSPSKNGAISRVVKGVTIYLENGSN